MFELNKNILAGRLAGLPTDPPLEEDDEDMDIRDVAENREQPHAGGKGNRPSAAERDTGEADEGFA